MNPLDRFPPFLCRAAARNEARTKALTVTEIALLSGISARTIKRLSLKTTWDNVSVDVAFRFAAACGIDLLSLKNVKRRRVTWTNRLAKVPSLLTTWESQRR